MLLSRRAWHQWQVTWFLPESRDRRRLARHSFLLNSNKIWIALPWSILEHYESYSAQQRPKLDITYEIYQHIRRRYLSTSIQQLWLSFVKSIWVGPTWLVHSQRTAESVEKKSFLKINDCFWLSWGTCSSCRREIIILSSWPTIFHLVSEGSLMAYSALCGFLCRGLPIGKFKVQVSLSSGSFASDRNIWNAVSISSKYLGASWLQAHKPANLQKHQ